MIRKSNYDKFPATKVDGILIRGWENIIDELQKNINTGNYTIVFDCYTGIYENEIIRELNKLSPELFINTRDLFKTQEEIYAMTRPFMTEDVLFGHLSCLGINDYFDTGKLDTAREKVHKTNSLNIIFGTGAYYAIPKADLIIYADMARWEIQQRFRKHEVNALGIDNRADAVSLQYKRGYFNDWKICDEYKRSLYDKIDFWVDTHIADDPKMIDKKTFFNGIESTVEKPFRVVPFFDPAPWGGKWMIDVCDLPNNKPNYGWCFDCVPEENSLYLNIDGINFEMPSVNVVYLESRKLLGEAVEARFGKEFPIRFDFLDTIGGGNLSLQVHPTTQFAHEAFGIHYTQDESYYLLDAEEDACVYLGIKNDIDPENMIDSLKTAQKGDSIFQTEKYINKFPARKHDHFLIPGGTIHCSGANSMVLEISSTPNLFTFKLWDWERLGLDGKPRPINIERGEKVIDFSRDTAYVKNNLVNQITEIAKGDGWKEEKTGLHPNEFIETRRHWFTKQTPHHTGNSVNVLNLVEGEEVIVESPRKKFEPFIVHYAETFIIPAHIGEYTITPHGVSKGKMCATIKASVRI
nr:class I mannose-6-phosphate isomerase [Coprobacter tertius]